MKTVFKVFTADIFSKIFSVITSFLLIRGMTTTDYADYAIITSIVTIISGIILTGFNRIYILDFERIKNQQFNILVIQLIGIFVLAIVGLPFKAYIGNHYWLVILLLIGTCIFSFVRTVYQQKSMFRYFTLIEIIRVFLFCIFVSSLYLFAEEQMSLKSIIVVQIISLISASIFLIKILYTDKSFSFNKNIFAIVKVLFVSNQLYLFMNLGIIAISNEVDVLLLGLLGSDFMLASYASGRKYYSLLLMALTSVNSVLLPTVNNAKSNDELRKLYRQYDKILLLFIVLVGIAILIAPWIIPIIDGGKYPDSINIFRILCISSLISFAGSPYNNILLREKKYKFMVINNLLNIGVSVLLNVILIPIYGGLGTALSMLIAMGILNMSSRFYGKRLIMKTD
ncbi:oligosaccharide flippase family protein [Paenisporosarcina sp. TG-14]|uniref:oligosaccharide flippase family protein n=1 Tax=Paenisporosarcina sp. TG-14 TaxID=1231057 RepID=UPI00031CF2BA|nr:polysaccharide biosynthesis C-terminal domain-containing protein [Paenisporosarcina sp. TG-14]